jgi:hypothetical protein
LGISEVLALMFRTFHTPFLFFKLENLMQHFKKINYFIYISFFLVSLASCGGGNTEAEFEITIKENVKVEIVRLEQQMFKTKSKKAIEKLLAAYPDFAEKYMQKSKLPHDSIAIDQIYKMITTPQLDTLYQEVQRKIDNITQIKKDFETAFARIKHFYPSFKIPKIYTVVTGMGSFFGREIFVSEDMWVISLDFFLLGDNPHYRPPFEQMPAYIQKRLHKHSIVRYCMELVSSKFIKSDFTDKTTLADMIFYGKSLYFTKMMLPQLPDSTLFGYAMQDLKQIDEQYSPKNIDKNTAQENRTFIWNYMIDKQIFFEDNELDKNTYIGEAPYVTTIGKRCPARIGRWFGYRIIRKYTSKFKDVTFQKLMNEADAKVIFNQSKYNAD